MDPGEELTDPDEVLQALMKRAALVRQLADGPRYVRDVQEDLSVSRSTAYKGIRELQACGVVEQTENGYRLSSFGQSLLTEYEALRDRTNALCRAETLLSFVRTDDALPTDVLVGATITYPTRHAPGRPVHVIQRAVEDARSLRGFSPVVLPEYVTVFHDRLVSGALTAELLLERPVLEHMVADYTDHLDEALETGELAVRETLAELPYGLVVVDEPHPEVVVVIYDSGGELRGTVSSDSTAAVEWGRRVYRTYRSKSTEIEPGEVSAEDPCR